MLKKYIGIFVFGFISYLIFLSLYNLTYNRLSEYYFSRLLDEMNQVKSAEKNLLPRNFRDAQKGLNEWFDELRDYMTEEEIKGKYGDKVPENVLYFSDIMNEKKREYKNFYMDAIIPNDNEIYFFVEHVTGFYFSFAAGSFSLIDRGSFRPYSYDVVLDMNTGDNDYIEFFYLNAPEKWHSGWRKFFVKKYPLDFRYYRIHMKKDAEKSLKERGIILIKMF